MSSTRSRGQLLAVAIAVVLASLLVPGVVAQQTGQPEGEPNDAPQNATFVAPGAPVSGTIASNGTNASGADSDWFAVPVQQGQTVTVTFESAADSERLLVFLADPSRVENPRNASANASDAVVDIDTTMGNDTVTLNATTNQSGVYFLGVTGLSGEYEFTVETTTAAMSENGTNATGTMNGTETANASGTTQAPTETTTSTRTTQSTTATEPTSAASTSGSGGEGSTAGGEGTSASGPGFGLIAALVALLAAALLAARR